MSTQSIHENSLDVLERLGSPEDTYQRYPGQDLPPLSPRPATPPWQPPVRVELELVYPPRPPVIGKDDDGNELTRPITADWLRTMMDEQEACHRAIRSRLKEAQQLAREATADVMVFKVELEDEKMACEDMYRTLGQVIGREDLEALREKVANSTENGESQPPEKDAETTDTRLPNDEENHSGDATHIIQDDEPLEDDEEYSPSPPETNVIARNSMADYPPRPASPPRTSEANDKAPVPAAAEPKEKNQPAAAEPETPLISTPNAKGKEKAKDTNSPVATGTEPKESFFSRIRDKFFPPGASVKRGREEDGDEDEPDFDNSEQNELRRLQKEASLENVDNDNVDGIEFISSNLDTLDRSRPVHKKRKTVSRTAMYRSAPSPPPGEVPRGRQTRPEAGTSLPAFRQIASTAAVPDMPSASSGPVASSPQHNSDSSTTSNAVVLDSSQPIDLSHLANIARPPPTVRPTAPRINRPLARTKERVIIDRISGEAHLVSDITETPGYLDQLRADAYNNIRVKEQQAENARRQAAEAAGEGRYYEPTPVDERKLRMLADVEYLARTGQEAKFHFTDFQPGDIIFDRNY